MGHPLSSVEAWDAATPATRTSTAKVLLDQLLEAGHALEFQAIVDVVPFVPSPTLPRPPPRAVAVFFDRAHRLEWVLVPGGTLAPWGPRETDFILAAQRSIEGWRVEQGLPFGLDAVRPYGATRFSASRLFRPTAAISPFLTTARPLLGSTPGLVPPIDPTRNRLLPFEPGRPDVFSVLRDELDVLLGPRGWALPTPAESQWMTGAGGFVFPWGNALPPWLWEYGDPGEDELTERDPFADTFRTSYEEAVDWTGANAFGLIDPLVASHWVRDGDGLCWHGGTAECAPWQSCGEWAGFLTAAIVVESEDAPAWSSHSVRPVIRL